MKIRGGAIRESPVIYWGTRGPVATGTTDVLLQRGYGSGLALCLYKSNIFRQPGIT